MTNQVSHAAPAWTPWLWECVQRRQRLEGAAADGNHFRQRRHRMTGGRMRPQVIDYAG